MSMRFILLDVDLFHQGDRSGSETDLLWLLEVLTQRNVRYLEQNPGTPKLYDSGVRYALPDQMAECRVDPSKLDELSRYLGKIGASPDTIEAVLSLLRGIEIFRDIPRLYERKNGDCDNIAAARAAELRMAGVKATVYITWRERPDGTTYHALVRWPDGSSEDPSILLGMGGAGKERERAEERRKNRERFDTFVEAAQALCGAGAGTPNALGRKIDALGLLPKRNWPV